MRSDRISQSRPASSSAPANRILLPDATSDACSASLLPGWLLDLHNIVQQKPRHKGGVKSNRPMRWSYGKGLSATSVTPQRSGSFSLVTCTGTPSSLASKSISAILSTLARQLGLAD